MSGKTWTCKPQGIALAAVLGVAAPPAAAQLDLTNVAFAPVTGPTSIPIGHTEFCKLHRDECGAYAHVVEATVLTESRWAELVQVNNALNSSIVPVTDADFYQVDELWTYPAGYGDCEDIALAKRRQLINAGWDASTLIDRKSTRLNSSH